MFGSRWNSPGRLVLYTADSPLGAIDEVMFYRKRALRDIDAPRKSVQLALHKIRASGAVQLADVAFEDERTAWDWSGSRFVGDQWFDDAQSPILAYHSTFAPNGFNFVLNLRHPALSMQLQSSYSIDMKLA